MKTVINPDGLIWGIQVYPLTQEITLVPGTYKRGDALGVVDGKHGLIGETGFDATTFNAVLCADMTAVEDVPVMGYVNGQFQGSKMRVKEGFDIETLKPVARKLQIFIK